MPRWLHTCMLSRVWLFVTPWTVAHQAPLSMGFPRQEYWNGLRFPPPGDLCDPGIEPKSPSLPGGFFIIEPSRKPAHIAGKTSFLGVPLRVFPKEHSIWIGGQVKFILTSAGGVPSNALRVGRTRRWRQGEFAVFAWGKTSSHLAIKHQHSWLSGPWTQTKLYHQVSWVSSLELVGYLGIHNGLSQDI